MAMMLMVSVSTTASVLPMGANIYWRFHGLQIPERVAKRLSHCTCTCDTREAGGAYVGNDVPGTVAS